MWDLVSKRFDTPIYRLLGDEVALPKVPYTSALFGNDPAETLALARRASDRGFRAAKFGWGPYGIGNVAAGVDHVAATREGLGPEGILLVDAGTVWFDAVERAAARLDHLRQHGVTWLEEPFVSGAFGAYRALAARSGTVRLAAGEGCHTPFQAKHLMDHAGSGFI
ncbi:MAG: hypothetical protein H0U40_04655 [Chloroflexia bacterium]|nr:hypothetical protein [Chloroflexia bacterium]